MNRSAAFLSVALGLSLAACGGEPAHPETAVSPLAGKRPSAVYTSYVAAIGNATAIHEVYPFLSAAARRTVTSDLETLKLKVPSGVLKVTEEKIEGERATVRIDASIANAGNEEPSTGTILFAREGGLWKIAKETWAPR